MKKLLKIIVLIFLTTNVFAEYQGKYCVMDDAYTENGDKVYGEFYMYSEDYGEPEPNGAYTENNEYIYGECHRYSGDYCEMDDVYTESGEKVYGGCYIF